MNIHNMRQKNLYESYMPPPRVISRCYSSKGNLDSFTTHIPGNSLFSVNRYLGSVGNFNKKNHGVGHPGLRMPLVKESGCESGVDPIVKLVGGFVGSKSQAGSSNHRGREFSLWDVIFDKIIDLVEHPEQQKQPAAKKLEGGGRKMPKIQGFAMIGVRSFSGANDSNYLRCVGPKWSSVPRECDEPVCKAQFPELGVANGQNCTWKSGICDTDGSKTKGDVPESEVTRLKDCFSPDLTNSSSDSSGSTSDCLSLPEHALGDVSTPSPVETCYPSHRTSYSEHLADAVDQIQPSEKRPISQPSPIVQAPCQRLISESEDESIPSDVLSSSLESHSAETFLFHKKVQRSISECSADSDDSFIVFESTEDEPVISDESDDDDESSSDEDLDEIDNCILISHNCDFSAPQQTLSRLEEANRKWNRTYGCAPVRSTKDSDSKKVKFAEGKDLTKVKRLVTWDFAHRAARIGPWEMYHRDSERFKDRISTLSSVISPVLAQNHRKKIYSQRFQT